MQWLPCCATICFTEHLYQQRELEANLADIHVKVTTALTVETRFLFLKGQRCWFWVIILFLRGKNNTICLKKLPCLHIAVQTIWVTNHSACSVANIFSLTGYEWTGRLYWRNFLFCWESFPRTLHFIGVVFKLFYFWGRGP